jgi:hypothetical protein
MELTSPGKLAVLVIALVGAFVGLFTGTVDDAAAVGIITAILGYVIGNGVGAKRGTPQAPLFAPKAGEPQTVVTRYEGTGDQRVAVTPAPTSEVGG